MMPQRFSGPHAVCAGTDPRLLIRLDRTDKLLATIPYFIFSPSTILSLSGILRGPDPTRPTPAEDWREAKVDVVIPALNEADNIILCLASVLRQTMKPRHIILIDDGSRDGTVERATAFCAQQGVELRAIQRRTPIGKTPTIKRQARELDSDVEFILDADTVLESDNYIERTVQELYQAVGIASAFGTVLPQRKKDRIRARESHAVQTFLKRNGDVHPNVGRAAWLHDFARGVTNLYREVLYLYLQRFIYRGQVVFFGTTSNPVGCAVAYRRKYVRALFDYIGPILGDDLTNSEDIFIGFAMVNEGYRNIQLTDVYARTVEPEVQRLPRQIYSWSSAFLQSCYYFDPLLRSPFKALKRWRARRQPGDTQPGTRRRVPQTPAYAGAQMTSLATAGAGSPGFKFEQPMRMTALGGPGLRLQPAGAAGGSVSISGDRRTIREPYRQAFGRARTATHGRPAGWILAMSAVEKVFFPASLLMMTILRWWEPLAVTVIAETAVSAFAFSLVMKGRRLEYVVKTILVTPIRYALLGFELVTIGRFAADLWLTGNRKWRK
jgi:glycosyltransferase involved in cell wall biosynthesis